MTRLKDLLNSENPRIFLLDLMPPEANCAEIGVWKGEFTNQILKHTNPQRLYLIDPFEFNQKYEHSWYGNNSSDQRKMDDMYQNIIEMYDQQIENGQILVKRISSAGIKAHIPLNSLNWIYIDGDHTYDAVKLDLQNSFDLVCNNGYITGDDYGLQGWWDHGVTKAVNEFILTYKDNIHMTIIRGTQFIINIQK